MWLERTLGKLTCPNAVKEKVTTESHASRTGIRSFKIPLAQINIPDRLFSSGSSLKPSDIRR
jgi:hypothetical protein